MAIFHRLTLILGFLVATNAHAVKPGGLLPVISVKGSVQGFLDHESMRGKVTVINFWATWCEACKVELREMEQEFAELARNQQFQFAMVALDKNPENAKVWLRNNLQDADNAVKQLFEDPNFEAAKSVGVDAFPMTLIVGPDLRVIHIQRGYNEGDGSTKFIAAMAREKLGL